MDDKIFIPKRINVGFREREDTYTGKLAYVIYYDQKNKLRKEVSWNSWRDKEIPNQEFENIPTEGFVLNKKAGGYATRWSFRQAYSRVYDPRGFEFEITIENLLYILENTNSIKGKGLEGEFVYGWSGGELILIPTASPDYKDLISYNSLLHTKSSVQSKELVIGATYLTKANESVIYMGKFPWWKQETARRQKLWVHCSSEFSDWEPEIDESWTISNERFAYKWVSTSQYVFCKEQKLCDGTKSNIFVSKTKLSGFLLKALDDACVPHYSELMEELEHKKEYSPIDLTRTEIIPYTLKEFKDVLRVCPRYKTFYNKDNTTIYTHNEGGYYKLQGEVSLEVIATFDATEAGIERMFNFIEPVRRNLYLRNGKLFKTVEGVSYYG